jgi:hypothetical protein
MDRIERLTAEQLEDLVAFREAELRRALSTKPIDHERARASVRALYAAAGQPEPQHVLIFTSPMLCLMARGLLRTLPATRDQLANQIWDPIWELLGVQLGQEIWDQLGEEVCGRLVDELEGPIENQLRDQLERELRNQLENQLKGELEGELRNQLENQLVNQLGAELNSQLWAQIGDQLAVHQGRDAWQPLQFLAAWDTSWLAFNEFGRRIGARYQQHTATCHAAYWGFARECGVSFLYPDFAFVGDRPELIAFDAQHRLHAADGPALRYRDGYALYAWHGQRIPAEYIEQRHTRPTADVLDEPNAEMRRILMEIYADVHGPDAMLCAMNAQLLAEDMVHGRPRRLYEIGGARYLHVVNGSLKPDGTRRTFLLGAHPEAATPHEAVAASYARPANRFREAVRT